MFPNLFSETSYSFPSASNNTPLSPISVPHTSIRINEGTVDLNPIFPNTSLKSRALVRIEVAKIGYVGSGGYQKEKLNSVEKRSLAWKELCLVCNEKELKFYKSHNSLFLSLGLDSANLGLSVYSPLEYTLAVTLFEDDTNPHTIAYIIQFPTPKIAKKWYLWIHKYMCKPLPIPNQITVFIPEVSYRIQVFVNKRDLTVWEVRDTVMQALQDDPQGEALVLRWQSQDPPGVTWKRLDAFEWVPEPNGSTITNSILDYVVSPQLIEHTHELHILTRSNPMLKISRMLEPYPSEGFMIFRGLNKEKASFSFLDRKLTGNLREGQPYYISTFSHFMTYTSSWKFSKNYKKTMLTSSTSSSVLLNPSVTLPSCAITPSQRPPLPKLRGLCKDPNNEDLTNDLRLLRNVDGLLDFKEISKVQHVEQPRSGGRDPWIEIILVNDESIFFEVWNFAAVDEWVYNLNQLIDYWKQYMQTKHEQFVEYCQFNQQLVHVSSPTHNVDISDVPTHGYLDPVGTLANPSLWTYFDHKSPYPVLKTGVLFVKHRVHSIFVKMMVVLTLDAIHFFEPTTAPYNVDINTNANPESESGSVNSRMNFLEDTRQFLHSRNYKYSHLVTLPLKNCFIYTKFKPDLAYSGSQTLPCHYPDQLTITDREEDCIFTVYKSHLSYLWPSEKRRKKRSRMGNCWDSFYRLFQLGHRSFWPWNWSKGSERGAGDKRIFLARTRLEADHWGRMIQLSIDYWQRKGHWD